jgi:hypothetical protein
LTIVGKVCNILEGYSNNVMIEKFFQHQERQREVASGDGSDMQKSKKKKKQIRTMLLMWCPVI